MIEDIFISPHPDDIAYSCFGAFHMSKNPCLLTVFGRSKYSANHCVNPLDENIVSGIRKKEDILFADYNNASYYSLNFPDTSLTLSTVKENSICNNSFLSQIKKRIIRFFKKKNIYNLYIPIGNGWHYDHRDIHRIIINLYNEEFISPNRLYLYEDLPYFAETTSSFSLTSYLQSEGICNVAITPHVFDLTDLENMWIYNYKIYESQFDKNEFNQILQYKYSHNANRLQEILWEIC